MTLQTKRNIMDLEILQKEYTNLLAEYNSSATEYTNYIGQQQSQTPQYVSVQGYAYNGTGNISEQPSNVSTVQQCEASCAKLGNCSGATFISQKCYLKTGDSSVTPSSSTSYAIIPKGKQLLLNMDNLNQQLLSVNKKIIDKINTDKPIYDQSVAENSIKNQELVANYDNLLNERAKIEDMLSEYNKLSIEESENQIVTTKHYYTYILLVILVISIIFLIYKVFSPKTQQIQYGGGELGINAYYFVGLLVCIIIVINYLYR